MSSLSVIWRMPAGSSRFACLGGDARAEQLGVEADQCPPGQLECPVVGADGVEPALVPPGCDRLTVRLAGQRVVADVVIAGHGMPGDGKAVEQAPCPVELAGIVRAVEGQVAEVDHEVGQRAGDVIDHRVPVRIGFGGTR
jgi:hypothetical protein